MTVKAVTAAATMTMARDPIDIPEHFQRRVVDASMTAAKADDGIVDAFEAEEIRAIAKTVGAGDALLTGIAPSKKPALARADIAVAMLRGHPERYLSLPAQFKNDEAFAKTAIAKDPRVLEFLPQSLRESPEVVAELAKYLGSFLVNWEGIARSLPEAITGNVSAMRRLIVASPYFAQFATGDAAQDELIRSVLELPHRGPEWLSEDLRKDKALIKHLATSKSPHVLVVADLPIQDRIDIAKRVVELDPANYTALPLDLRENEGVAILALADATKDNIGYTLRFLPKCLFGSVAIARQVALLDINRVCDFTGAVWEDTDFVALVKHKLATAFPKTELGHGLRGWLMERLIDANPALAFAPWVQRERTQDHSRSIIDELEALRKTDPWTHTRLVERSVKANIRHPERFKNVAQLERILADKEAPADDPRPICLVMAADADHNGAFCDLGDDLEDIPSQYRIVYADVTTDRDLLKECRAATQAKQASAILICGHGYEKGVQLGVLGMGQYLLGNEDDWLMKELGKCVKKGSPAILWACSTGLGGESADNFANFTAQHLQTNVVSADDVSYGISIDDDDLADSAPFPCWLRYVAKPKPAAPAHK